MIIRLNGGRHVNVHNYWNGHATMFQACWSDSQGNEMSMWTKPYRSFDLAVRALTKGEYPEEVRQEGVKPVAS